MSNTTTSTIDIAGAVVIILTMDRYMIVILYIIGTLGAILNTITFLEKQIRINPCSIYFLSTSIVDFCIMNVFILMEIITIFNKPLSNLIYSTKVWCQLGNYIMFLLPCLSSSYITFASIDRFCISSLNQTLRKWSTLKLSRIVVIIVFIIWALFSLHVPIAYNLIEDPVSNITRCTVQGGLWITFIIIDGFFFALFKGAIVPCILCIFGLMILWNIKRSRNRVIPQLNTRRNTATTGPISRVNPMRSLQNRRDSHMLSMLLVQVVLTIFLNIPFMVIYLFGFFNPAPTDLLPLLLSIIFSFIARWFYYMNYCKTFYINTLTSKLFRKSIRQQFMRFFRQYRRINQ